MCKARCACKRLYLKQCFDVIHCHSPSQVDPNNASHVGGNTWAGGTGGRDTAGLGGKGGPYWLDAGHNVHQLSDVEMAAVPEEVRTCTGLCYITGTVIVSSPTGEKSSKRNGTKGFQREVESV